MPTALHPQAKFDPISPDLDLHALVDSSPNFDWVTRISISQIRRLGPSDFEKLVQLHVIEGGRPLIVDGWNKFLPESLFGAKWLEDTYDKKQENVRDLGSQSDIPMTTGHYLRSMRQLTNKWNGTNYRDERRQRLYLKDIDCPTEWFDHLRKIIPPNVLYMNNNVSENNSPNSRNDDIFGAPEPTAAVAGDLMSCLPEEMRAQNLMCYIGHEGTYTPAHKEMCATLGQNIMVDASGDENGNKPGSSIWFMTETKDREVVREYFLSMLGHDVEIEKHFAQINAWKKANFPVYVVEQKVGDFILIPPLAPHQVWNRGTRTMKVAWNRTTVETLDLALHEALPRSRLVCRDEQYKNKAIIYYALEKYYKDLQSAEDSADSGILGLGRELTNLPRLKQMANDFRRLFGLFTEILVDEMFGYKHINTEFIEFDSNITCSYCRSNIFNRFLTCKCCVRQLANCDEDTYDICMECYAMGRSCVCISGLQWCEQWRWSDLVDKHETWRAMVITQDGFVDIDSSPQPLEIARKKTGKKSIAQICQEQLQRRPWNDITKPVVETVADESEPEPEVDDDGRVKKKPKSKRKVKKGDTYRCHVCCHKDYTYRLNFCTTCEEAYCYGVLFRAFDTMPQAAMEQELWRCPKCLGICNCGACRRAGNTKPYVPKSTLLGHDTRKIADDRSIESVVDFRIHNLSWLKGAGEETRSKNSKRMQRLKEQADAEKARDPLVTTGSVLPDPINNNDGPQGLMADIEGYHAPMAGMDTQSNTMDDSAYPDPLAYPSLTMGGRMMGMGFYDQDDTANRILFDAFQMPSADTIDDEPEVSEFVKKTLRMAKRKARQEIGDDPDFRGPRTNYRKKPRTSNHDQLVNLDPALLENHGNINGGQSATPARSEAISAEGSAGPDTNGEPTNATSEQSKENSGRPSLPVDPLRPQLRHAKPAQSYVESEDFGEDLDDAVVFNPIKFLDAENDAPSANGSVDLVAEAISALTEQDTATASSKPQQEPKKRGRPPGKSRSSLPGSAEASASKEPKKRGRPPRASKPLDLEKGHVEDGEDITMTDAPEPSNDHATDDVEAAPKATLTRNVDSGETSAQKDDSSKQPVKKRGRPPGRKAISASHPAVEAEPVPAPSLTVPKMMSMAERVAARGGKFKMKSRIPPRISANNTSSASLTSGRVQNSSAEPSSTTEASHHARSPARGKVLDGETDKALEKPLLNTSKAHGREASARPVKSLNGMTVVRMVDEPSDNFESSDSDSVFDDDDDGIPAQPRHNAIRGGRGRGRGGRIAVAIGRSRGRG